MSRKRDGCALKVEGACKSFTMHLQGGARLSVIHDAAFELAAGECVALGGPSGTGKSSLLKMIYGNYLCDRGQILVRRDQDLIDVALAAPRRILDLRRTTFGYVSQFLRVIPRIAALDLVSRAGMEIGMEAAAARTRAAPLLERLNLPSRLWDLPPATFSGGEQQRVNIACGFIGDRPILLLDEPTASLDAVNRRALMDLLLEKKEAGVAVLGIFHDERVRERVVDRVVDVSRFAPTAA